MSSQPSKPSVSDTSGLGGPLSRRAFIRVAGGAAAATGVGLLLAACGGAATASTSPIASPSSAPPSPSSPASASAAASASASPSVSASAAASASGSAAAAPSVGVGAGIQGPNASAMPTYIAQRLLTPPDFPSADPRVTPAYNHYPKNPPKSWTGSPPGTGSTVNVFVAALYPPPIPYPSNPTWQAINKAMNANVQMTIVAPQDYPLKLSTLMASGDIPDIISLFGGLIAAQDLPQFFQAQCADLTPYLAGDKAKDYPNLAAIPTYAWNNSDSAIDGHLWTWPIHRYLPGLSYFFKNTDMWNGRVGEKTVPKDATDLKKIMQELNDPSHGVWAIGNLAMAPFNFGIFGYQQMFGAPQFYGLDDKGNIVRDWETDQFKAALGYVQDLWKSGLMWPDASTSHDSRSNFVAKKFAMSVEGFGNSWNDFWFRGLEQKPPTHFDIILPFGADANTKVQSYISGGYISTVVMKKGSPDRIQELLRILDYLASPFGTQEDMLLTYGLADKDYTLNATGDPVPTPDGKNRAGYVPWQYISEHPYVTYYAGIPGYAAKVHPVEEALVNPKIAVPDVTLGYYARSAYTANARTASTTVTTAINDVILGRRPFSDWDGVVKTWLDTAGNQIKKEYMDAFAAAKK